MNSSLGPLRIYHRKLPHWRIAGASYNVTWRLYDRSVPLLPAERTIVLDALRYFRRKRYDLFACVVMDDHVHTIVRPFEDVELSAITHTWKSYSARELQQQGFRIGQVWQHESYDRIIRSTRDQWEKTCYIQNNPIRRWPELRTYPWVWPPLDGIDASV